MDFINKIYSRSKISNLCYYFLYGSEPLMEQTQSLNNRIKTSNKELTDFLDEKYPNVKEFNKISEKIYSHIGTTEKVYFELGFRMGAKFISELLEDINK